MNFKFPTNKRQSGVVLIPVMLIFVIASYIAIEIQENQYHVLQLTQSTVVQDARAARSSALPTCTADAATLPRLFCRLPLRREPD